MVRDAALAASGLLSPKIGGPSVFPPQPDGIWDSPYSDDKWVDERGRGSLPPQPLHVLRRTSPYPSFMTFDATSRELCTVRRVRTNTPLQALTLLNDAAFFEAARALARRMMRRRRRHGAARPRPRSAFRLVARRAKPTPAEVERIVAVVRRRNSKHFRADAAAPATLVAVAGRDADPRRAARRGRSSRTCC